MQFGRHRIVLLGVGVLLPLPLFAQTDNELLEELRDLSTERNTKLDLITAEVASLRTEFDVATQGIYDGMLLALLCYFLFDLIYRAILER